MCDNVSTRHVECIVGYLILTFSSEKLLLLQRYCKQTVAYRFSVVEAS